MPILKSTATGNSGHRDALCPFWGMKTKHFEKKERKKERGETTCLSYKVKELQTSVGSQTTKYSLS